VFGNDSCTAFIGCTGTITFKRLLAWLRRQPPGIGGTHWVLIGILVLLGIVLAIRLGIALRVRSRNRRAMAEYVASRCASLDERRTLGACSVASS
jgi:hypothetical protein